MSRKMKIYLLGSIILFVITSIVIRMAANYYGLDAKVPAYLGIPMKIVFLNALISSIIFAYYAFKDIFKN